ncbi:hypothetical protein SVA_0288 [Sulfurifustis variabilis]|uniref:Uncharacterized protein n=1 Tax=Sulfurifustis variabilis TaxID=1675686 RepID=A0A1B4V0A2_9GAMM|nr:hypothetical protein [Sulfurifustis variabilis]BAU46870.1 hypothetical protein SVA_0288 [Sulfurifustis variabilis]
MKPLAYALALGLALSTGTALAFHCPMDMKKIDAALAKGPTVSGDQLAEVRRLRAQGEEYHKQGKHQESVDTLARAMKILDIQ